MNWVATVAIIDPDHNQPPARRCPTYNLMSFAIGKVGLNSAAVLQRLLNILERDMAFGMIGTKMSAIRGIPDIRRLSTRSVYTIWVDKGSLPGRL